MNDAPTWTTIHCGIPGYDMTALAYAQTIMRHAARGEFSTARYYLNAAAGAGQLTRIEEAARASAAEKP